MRVGVFSILSTLYILYITISAKKTYESIANLFFLAFDDYMYIKQYKTLVPVLRHAFIF